MIVYDYVIFFRLGKFITTPGLLGPVPQKFYLTKRKNNIIITIVIYNMCYLR